MPGPMSAPNGDSSLTMGFYTNRLMPKTHKPKVTGKTALKRKKHPNKFIKK